ncbi:MAG: hypothetical protein HS102_07975 [Planctomycetia bacterium]|nr:hypothetical protein [Planctomycetia bacterium]
MLGIWATHQLVVVLSIHGEYLTTLYERTFSPAERPILKLELLLLAMAVVAGMRAPQNANRLPEGNVWGSLRICSRALFTWSSWRSTSWRSSSSCACWLRAGRSHGLRRADGAGTPLVDGLYETLGKRVGVASFHGASKR